MSNVRSPEKHLEQWLHQAWSMEVHTLPILERQKEALQESCPDLVERIEAHWRDSHSHVERVAECLHLLRGKGPDKADIAPAAAGNLWRRHFMQRDGIGSSVLHYMLEHYEISHYKVIIEAARQNGIKPIIGICEEILCEEEEMAFWLEHHLPEVTRNTLSVRCVEAE